MKSTRSSAMHVNVYTLLYMIFHPQNVPYFQLRMKSAFVLNRPRWEFDVVICFSIASSCAFDLLCNNNYSPCHFNGLLTFINTGSADYIFVLKYLANFFFLCTTKEYCAYCALMEIFTAQIE